MHDRQLEDRLHECELAAKAALRAAIPCRDQVLARLKAFAAETRQSRAVGEDTPESERVREVLGQFSERLEELSRTLDILSNKARGDLSASYAHLEENAALVTIMLFGRTRAGKSTLMEALTHGNGKSIGTGKQHATRKVQEYFWPPSQHSGRPEKPSLRIVDTPGIEGFKGDGLAVMADGFVERCDHIFFLLSDDKASTEELERFGLIRTHGKAVTVLLNVKSRDQILDILVVRPELIFRNEEIDGHKRRIHDYLLDRFDLSVPTIIPIHARAAWLSTRPETELELELKSASLRERSRIAEVEERILQFIAAEAVPARIKAPRDLIRGYIITVKSELRPFAGQFKKLGEDMVSLRGHLESGVSKAKSRATLRLQGMRASIDAANERIPLMVDELAATGSRGSALRKRWEELLEEAGVKGGLHAFVAETTSDFQKEIREQVRTSSFDVKLSASEDRAEDLLDEYLAADKSARSHKYARAAIRSGAAAAASGLAAWAIANFWNPSGWVAAIGAAAAGIAADRIAKSQTDSWRESTAKELQTKRNAVTKELRSRLKRVGGDIEERCVAWLDDLCTNYALMVGRTLGAVEGESLQMRAATVGLLRALDGIASELDKGLITDLMKQVVPEVADGSIEVVNVAREPGVATKVCVKKRTLKYGGSVAFCVGRGGCRVRQLRELLGGESVVFVDGEASLRQQVCQALHPVEIRETSVSASTCGSYTIRAPAGTAGRLIGHRGANIRLTSWLIGRRLVVVE